MKKLSLPQLIFLIIISILLLPLAIFLGLCFFIYSLIVKRRINNLMKQQMQAQQQEQPNNTNPSQGRTIDHE